MAVLLSMTGACGLLAGCVSGPTSLAQQVSQWASGATVSANDGFVVQDVAAIRRSAKRGLLKDFTSNCAGLVYDSGTAYGNLPTPDNTLTNELNVAYEDFAAGGNACAAVHSLHSLAVARAMRKIAEGVVALDRATRRLAADGVH
jgi:hypothetical protein